MADSPPSLGVSATSSSMSWDTSDEDWSKSRKLTAPASRGRARKKSGSPTDIPPTRVTPSRRAKMKTSRKPIAPPSETPMPLQFKRSPPPPTRSPVRAPPAPPRFKIQPGKRPGPPSAGSDLARSLALARPTYYEKHPELASQIHTLFRQKLARVDLVTMNHVSDKFRTFDRTSFQTGVLTHDAANEEDLPIQKNDFVPELPVEQKMVQLLDVLHQLPQCPPLLSGYPQCGQGRKNRFVSAELLECQVRSQCMPDILDPTAPPNHPNSPGQDKASFNAAGESQVEAEDLNTDCSSETGLEPGNNNNRSEDNMPAKRTSSHKKGSAPPHTSALEDSTSMVSPRKLTVVVRREDVEQYRSELDRSPRGSLSLNQSKDEEDPIQSSSLNQGNQQDYLELTVPKLFETPKVTSTPKGTADDMIDQPMIRQGPSQKMETIVPLTRRSSSCSSTSSSVSSTTRKKKDSVQRSHSKSESREAKTAKSATKIAKPSSTSKKLPLKPPLMREAVSFEKKSSYKIPKKIRATNATKSTNETTSSSITGNHAKKKPGGRLVESSFLASLFENSPKPKAKLNRTSSSQSQGPKTPKAAIPTATPPSTPDAVSAQPEMPAKSLVTSQHRKASPTQESSEVPPKARLKEPDSKVTRSSESGQSVKRKRLSLKDYQSKKAKQSPIQNPNPALEEGEVPDSDDEISIVGLVTRSGRDKVRSPKAISPPLSSREPSISSSSGASSSDRLLIDEDKTATPTSSEGNPPTGAMTGINRKGHEVAHPLRVSPSMEIDRGPRRKKEVTSSEGGLIASRNLHEEESEKAKGHNQHAHEDEDDEEEEEAVQLELDSADRLDLDESEDLGPLVQSTSRARQNATPPKESNAATTAANSWDKIPSKDNSQEFIDAMPPSLRGLFMALYSRRLCFKQLEFGLCQRRQDQEAHMRKKQFQSQILGAAPPKLRCCLNHDITYDDFKTFLLLICESTEDQLPLMLRPRTHNRFTRIMGVFNANKHWINVHFIIEVMAIVIGSAKLAVEPSFEFCIVIETIVNDLDHFQKIFEFPDQHPPPVLAGFKTSIERLFNQILDLVATLVQFSEHHRGSNGVLKLTATLDKVFALSSFWGLVLSAQSFSTMFHFFCKYEKAFQKPLNVLYHFAFLPGFVVESRDLDLFLRKFVNDLDLTALQFALVPIVLILPAEQFRELFTQFSSVKSLVRRTVEPAHQVPCAAIFDRIRAEQLTDLISHIPDVEEFIDTSALDELSVLLDDPTRRFQLLNVLDQRLLSPFRLRAFFLDLVKLFCEKEDPKEVDGIFSDFAEMFFKNPFRPPIALHFLAQLRNTLVIHLYTLLKDIDPEDRSRSLEHLYLISSMSPERLVIPGFQIWSIPSMYDPTSVGFECLLKPSRPFETLQAGVMLLLWKRCDQLALTIFHQDASEITLQAPRHERVDLASEILRLKMSLYRSDGGLALNSGVLDGVLVLFREHILPFMIDKRVNALQCVEDSNNFLTFWLSHCQFKANRDSLQATILPLCRQYRTKLTLWEATMRSLVHTLELQGFSEEADQFYARARDLNYYVNQSSLDDCFAFPFNISPHELTVILRCFFKCLLEENLLYDPRVLEDLVHTKDPSNWARYRIAITYVPSGCSATGLPFLDVHANTTPEMGRRRLRQALKSLKPPIETDQNGESFNPRSLICHLVRMSQS